MSFTIRIEGLTAVPGSFKNPTSWRDPTLFSKLKEKKVDLEKIDDIFRKHWDDFLIIAGWIAHRDSMKKIRKEKPSTGEPEFRSFLTKEEKRKIDLIIGSTLSGLEAAELCLKERAIAICGSTKGLRTLSRENVRGWLIFTKIMSDLYSYLFDFYLRKAYDYELKLRQPPEYAMFPTELCQDIAKLMKEYFPSLFQNYDSENVKNRIKEPVEKALSKKPTKNFSKN